MKKSKKKAFTLTELLIVVIVIGVLSAAVLPKFNKVIETRKTTEAEELMASVRTEQEKRCALDKRYLTQMSEMTDIVKNNETKNFTIALAGRGIDATRKDKYSYTLKMLSYADGRICCDGKDCSKLNKEYPTCEELKGKPDYQESPENCAGPSAVWGCAGDAEEPCGCNNNGKRTRTCDTATGTWSEWGECKETKPSTTVTCNKCGKKTCELVCDDNAGWKVDKTKCTACSKTASECSSSGGGSGTTEDPCVRCTRCYNSCMAAYKDATFCDKYCLYDCSGCDECCGSDCDYTECGAECGAEEECGTGCGTECGGVCNNVLCTEDYYDLEDSIYPFAKPYTGETITCPIETLNYHVNKSCEIQWDYGEYVGANIGTYHCSTTLLECH